MIDTVDPAAGIVLVVGEDIRFTRSVKALRQSLDQHIARAFRIEPELACELLEQLRSGAPWTNQAIDRDAACEALINIERNIAQNLIREATMCLQHVKRIDREIMPTHVYVRSQQLDADAISNIADGLDLKLGDWSLFTGDGFELNHSGSSRPEGSEWAVALGLALYGNPAAQAWRDAA